MLASHLTFSSALLLLFPFGGAASPAELHSRLRPHGNAGVAGFGTNRALPTSNLYPGEAQAAPERQDPEGFTSYSLPSSPTYKPSPTSVITDGTLSQAHGGVYPAAPSRWKHAAGLTRAARTKSTPPSSFTKPAQASKHLAPVSGTTVAQDSTSSHTVTLRNAGSAHLIPNSYIIKYNISHGHEAIRAHVEHTMRLMRKRTLNASAPMDFRVYNVSTFVAMGLSSVSTGTMEAMASHAAVEYVEADTLVFAQGWATQPGAEAGLARLSHCAPGAHRPYVYDATAGAGATAYVVDTGIHVNHPDFENRATHGFNVLAGNTNAQDTYGHGTHVAGIIGSRTFGVAKKASLVAVKVLEGGQGGSSTATMAGLQWAYDDILAKGRLGKALINTSLRGPRLQSLNAMVQTLHDNGVMVTAAAGNDNADVSGFSPASAPSAMTVGNIDPATDARAPTSNYGGLVKIWAPGQNIRSTWIDDGGSFPTRLLSGTSAAAPHVAGLVALIMSKDGLAEPAAIEATLREQAQSTGAEAQGVLGSPRFVANNGYSDCRQAAESASVSSIAAPTASSPESG